MQNTWGPFGPPQPPVPPTGPTPPGTPNGPEDIRALSATESLHPDRARKPVKRDEVSLDPAVETDSRFFADDRAVAREGVALLVVDDDDALYFNE